MKTIIMLHEVVQQRPSVSKISREAQPFALRPSLSLSLVVSPGLSIVPLEQLEYGVYGDLIRICTKPYSTY